MLESSTLPENPDAGEPGNGQLGDGSFPARFGDDDGARAEEVEPGWSGNRWPRQETFALLEIRSDMDSKFRDSSFKAPLWEEVSRKMGELGYCRSAKKCKEKFENIYKYHKRTRDGRSGRRTNGKAYRFFEQLEALDHHHQFDTPFGEKDIRAPAGPGDVILDAIPCSVHKPAENSTSSDSSSSRESEGTQRKKKKLRHFFERLMKEVVDRQEGLQRKFLETLEKCEQDRLAREEAWKVQELARIKRETELLVQERSIAAAKDAAVLAFLKKFSDQSDPVQFPDAPARTGEEIDNTSGKNFTSPVSSSRWPKDEVDALIKLRTNLDTQYQETGPKGPLWEEISGSMKRLGFNRSAKRCKEKWENINKYFKRVKESNKRRLQDSKTCPYFHQLDALYSKKSRNESDSVDSGYDLRPEELLMHMMGQPGSVSEENRNVDDQEKEKEKEKVNQEFYQIENDNNNASQMASDNDPSMETME